MLMYILQQAGAAEQPGGDNQSPADLREVFKAAPYTQEDAQS